MFSVWLAVAGLLIGSFLNVVAIRTVKRQSVAFPPSHCMSCGHRLHAVDLVPLVSYAALGGRCRYCRARISPAYPVGEAATALLFAWSGWHFGADNPEWIAGLLLASVMVVITHTDLTATLIPNAVVFPAIALAVALRAFVHPLPWWNYAAAAAIGFGMLYVLAVVSKGGMGGGDIKLFLFVGLVGGIASTVLTLFIASALGALYGLVAKASGKLARKQPIPFGPFIAAGSWLAFLYGPGWIDAYLAAFAAAAP